MVCSRKCDGSVVGYFLPSSLGFRSGGDGWAFVHTDQRTGFDDFAAYGCAHGEPQSGWVWISPCAESATE